jgi:hypothetical protein
VSDTPWTDKMTNNGWSEDAACVSAENCRRMERQRNRLRTALKSSACPRPPTSGDGTVADCVRRGVCECDNVDALRF